MLAWDNGGLSPDASVRIAASDRPGLERRLRYCARPALLSTSVVSNEPAYDHAACPL
ncbi:MAG: hypothetical protein P8Y27_16055 [Chromatiaceae bacterium]|jgi:hypothetical protein